MTLSQACFDSLTILAIVLGPIIALSLQRRLDQQRESRNRKLAIFKTLMSFRATRVAPAFVQALNLIDVEFTGTDEKRVRDAWKELQDHFAEWGQKQPAQRKTDDQRDTDKSTDLLAELLVKMGAVLGYEFDKVYIKKAAYYPEGLGNIEAEQHSLRRRLLGLLAGESSLPVAVFEQRFAPMAAEVDPRN